MKTTAKIIEKRLNDNGVYPGRVYKSKGNFVAHFYFFYPHGQSSQGKADKILEAIPEANIVDHYDNWQTWPKDSYFEVRFTI